MLIISISLSSNLQSKKSSSKSNFEKNNKYIKFKNLNTEFIKIKSNFNLKKITNKIIQSKFNPIEIANYNYPKNLEETDEVVIAVMGTNDVHGGAYERNLEYEDQEFEKGGFKYFSGALDIIREEFAGNSLWLDAGDQFSGTYDNIVTEGKVIRDFYNVMNLDAATLGNHEWDRGEEWLRNNMMKEVGRYAETQNNINTIDNIYEIDSNKIYNSTKNLFMERKIDNESVSEKSKFKSNFNNFVYNTNNFNDKNLLNKKANYDGILSDNNNLYLAANLIPKAGTEDLPNKSTSKIFTMKSGVRIGVIGLTTFETLYNNAHPPKNFEVKEYLETTISESNKLREIGVDAIILLTHIGTHCAGESKEELMELKLRDENYMKNSTFCDDELGELVGKLKNREVDLVIGGEGVEAHHFINGIPILQNPMTTVSANVAYLKFKKIKGDGGEVPKDYNSESTLIDNLMKSKIKFQINEKFIEGPVPLCSKIFSFNKRCDFVPTQKGLELVDYTWHGKKIFPNQNIHHIFDNPADKIIRKAKRNFIFKTDVRLERGNQKDNLLGSLLCEMTKKITNSDICIINYGALRTFWEPGRISEYDMMNMFPFGGDMIKYSIKGREIKYMIKILQEGKKSFYSTAGLIMKIMENCSRKRSLLKISLEDNNEIEEDKLYSVSGFDFFLVKGAADMSKVLKSGAEYFDLPKNIENFGDLRNRFIESFKEKRNVFEKDIKKNSIELIQEKC